MFQENKFTYLSLFYILTVIVLIKPSVGKKELKRIIMSVACILSQSILHNANLDVASSIQSASLSSSPQPCSTFSVGNLQNVN